MATARPADPVVTASDDQTKLYKRILFMHGQKAQNANLNIEGLGPQAEFKQGEIYSAFTKLKSSFEEAEEKIDAIADSNVKDKFDKLSSKLNELESKMGAQFDRWLKGYPCDKSTKWDNCFKEYNQALTELKDAVKNSADPKAKELKKDITALDSKTLQDGAFNKEMTSLNKKLTEKSNTDSFKIRHYQTLSDPRNASLHTDFWEKLHSSDEEKIKKEAEKKADEALVNISNAKNEVDHGTGKGAGIYSRKGSDYLINVSEKGACSAIHSPQESFAHKLGRNLLLLATAPLLLLAVPFAAAREDSYIKGWNNFLDKLVNRRSFEASFDKMLEFINVDPSGRLGADSVVMNFDPLKKKSDGSSALNQKHIVEVRDGIKLARERGIGFDIGPETREAFTQALEEGKISRKEFEKMFKELESYKIEFEAKKIATEKAGMKAVGAEAPEPTPTPKPSTTPIASSIPSDQLNQIKNYVAELKELTTGEVKPDTLINRINEMKDNIDKVDLEKINKNEIAVLNSAVAAIDEAIFHENVPEGAAQNSISNWCDDKSEIISNRKLDVMQEDLAVLLEEADKEGFEVNDDYRNGVQVALKEFDANFPADRDPKESVPRDKYDKLEVFRNTLKDAVDKLPDADKALKEKFEELNTKFEDMPLPAPSSPAPK